MIIISITFVILIIVLFVIVGRDIKEILLDN
jgi:hypothetical protein